ncbi:MAG: cohesin domain-containing protein, partial [Geobacteraceae bacterium]|nr:cohesin domain-containing protein [Geobacteraceae bacterium]
REGMERMLKSSRPKLDGFELNLKSTKPITLKFKDAKIKDIFNIITQLSGINFIFDEGVKDTNFSIFLENATFYQALDVITELNKLGKKVLNEKSIIIYPKNPEKHKQYEDLYLQTFYLNKIDAKKAVNLLRTMMQIKKIYVNEELNAIVVRDTPDVVELAGKILEANDIPDAEVVLEVEVIELSKRNVENLGFVLSRYAVSVEGFNNGTAFSDVLSTAATSSTTTAATPSNLLQLFAWRQFSGFLTVPNATFNFAKTLANGETLSNPRIRIKNREKAKFNVGTRVPITTTSSPTGGGVSVNVQYVDVGVKLNAEPTIQLNNEISIKLSMEVSSIGARETVGGTGSATTVVTIGTRNLDTVLSLKDGETSVIGGLIQDSKSKSKQKIALLGDIPIIGSIFSSHDTNNDKNELVLAITPRIVRGVTVPDQAVAAFWTGKEDEPSTEKLFASFTPEPELPQAPPEALPSAPAKAVPAAPQVPAKVAPPAAVAPVQEAAPAAPPSPAPQAQQPATGAEAPVPSRIVLDIAAPQTAKLNEEFRVEVMVAEAVNMYNARFTLEFDPALVDFVGAAEGAFLKQDGKPTSFTSQVNKETGRIDINLRRVGEVGGVSGAGALAVITFKAKGKGSVNLGFGGADAFAPGGKPLDADLYSTVTEVQ